MSAFLIVEVEVLDEQRYETYKQMVGASLKAYGGRFLVRGGRVEALEGEWEPGRLVIVEFPSMEDAEAWWGSEEYSEAKRVRREAARAKVILVEGVSGG